MGSHRSISVFIAEDHALMREGVRHTLEEGAQQHHITVVGEAADGEEAVRAATELKPDVVLMDISLPGISGVDATRRLKCQSPEIAVLMLTAYDDDPYVFASLEAGAAGYLLKDVSSEDLIAGIRAICQGESVLSPSVTRKLLRQASLYHDTKQAAEREPLTEREKQILVRAARGEPNKTIARDLDLSAGTVKFHLAHIF